MGEAGFQGLGEDQHHEHPPASMLQEAQLVVNVLVEDSILSVDQECLGYLVALEGTGDTLWSWKGRCGCSAGLTKSQHRLVLVELQRTKPTLVTGPSACMHPRSGSAGHTSAMSPPLL